MAGAGPSGYSRRMVTPKPGFRRPRLSRLQKQRLRRIPVRTLVPNVVTLLALCAGLTAIRLAFEDRYVLALGAIVFVAMPAPRAAIRVLLPIYAAFLGLPRSPVLTWLTLLYTLAIALLMVSRLPVFSGKRVGTRVPTEMVGPVILLVILSV